MKIKESDLAAEPGWPGAVDRNGQTAPLNSPFSHWQCLLPWILSLLLGCRSAPPPQARSLLQEQANQSAQMARRFGHSGQWTAAADRWRQAADHCALLNRRDQEAIARHNLGQALRQLHQWDAARKQLQEAAAINHGLGQETSWWRNQIALLQLESSEANTNALAARFQQLLPQSIRIGDPGLRGLFLNELGLWELNSGRAGKALTAFSEAEPLLGQAGDAAGMAALVANRALAKETQERWVAAEQDWQAALARFEALGDPMGIATALAGQGRVLVQQQRDLARAEDLLRRAVRNFELLQAGSARARTEGWLEKAVALQGRRE